MNTKELIELVKKAFGTWEDEYCLSKETVKGMNEIIVILQRNGKFEEMWKLLEAEMEGQYCITPMEVYFKKDTINQQMKTIKQKYFPKNEVLK